MLRFTPSSTGLLPCATRWNTMRDSLSYYHHNWPQLVNIIGELLPCSAAERKHLENMQIKNVATDLLKIFDAIAVALNKLQSDTATIGDAVEVRKCACSLACFIKFNSIILSILDKPDI